MPGSGSTAYQEERAEPGMTGGGGGHCRCSRAGRGAANGAGKGGEWKEEVTEVACRHSVGLEGPRHASSPNSPRGEKSVQGAHVRE